MLVVQNPRKPKLSMRSFWKAASEDSKGLCLECPKTKEGGSQSKGSSSVQGNGESTSFTIGAGFWRAVGYTRGVFT